MISSYLYTYTSHGAPDSESKYRIAPAERQQAVGSIAWGHGPTSSYLYASSESEDHFGAHRAVDVHVGKVAYNFSAKENGETMATDSCGMHTMFPCGDNLTHTAFD